MRAFGATTLPGLSLRDGVPSHLRTMVVVPALLTTRAALEAQIDRLEIHYLASPDGELYFALLSDWTDAPTENAAGDEALLAVAGEAIARLNRLHGNGSAGERFLLLHRRRVWSDVQTQWMGWERKRGKLHELNRLLRGATDTNFQGVNGRAPEVPSGVRYVITLDADTRLPRDTARRLVGKLAHPLNHPRFDACYRTSRRGVRSPAATGCAVFTGRSRRVTLPARLLELKRYRPVRLRRLGCLPGSLR